MVKVASLAGRSLLIAGGASLVGSHIARQALAQGAGEVVLFDNLAFGSQSLVEDLVADPRVKFIRGDVLSVDSLYDASEGVDGVFSVAAFLSLPLMQNLRVGMDVNLNGIRNILDVCRYRGIKKVVMSSSTAVYGSPPAEVHEETPYDSRGLVDGFRLYAVSKLLGEALCSTYSARHNIDWMALRYSTVYGEGQHARGVYSLRIVQAYDAILAGQQPVVGGDYTLHDYVYVGDVAAANCQAMASAVSGEAVNICSGRSVRLSEVLAIVAEICGWDLDLTQEGPEPAKKSVHWSNAKAKSLLGWSPEVDLEAGIARVIDWLRKEREHPAPADGSRVLTGR